MRMMWICVPTDKCHIIVEFCHRVTSTSRTVTCVATETETNIFLPCFFDIKWILFYKKEQNVCSAQQTSMQDACIHSASKRHNHMDTVCMGLKFCGTKLSWIADFHYICGFHFRGCRSPHILYYMYTLYFCTNTMIRLYVTGTS